MVYAINCRVSPENANRKDLKYTYETMQDIEVDKFGKIIFRESGSVIINVNTNDGSNVGITIQVYAL